MSLISGVVAKDAYVDLCDLWYQLYIARHFFF